ncbi:MAG: hypothetical protein MR974_06735, partial [Mitsuokella jalaludinii]|nr:hypothetical protein [Mitsuokella jalaludinii]
MRKLDKKFFEEMVKNKDLVENILHWDHLHKKSRFNTDDGIRRAAIHLFSTPLRWQKGGFNTDDGIRRAAIPVS